MREQSIVICGLPASGKTTFLAALWHLVTAKELPTKLEFASLTNGDFAHLNTLAARWRSAVKQDHTHAGDSQIVTMNLRNGSQHLRVAFPDMSGEVYQHMWEVRDCTPEIASLLADSGSFIFFINADTIEAPQWVVNIALLSKKLGVEVSNKPIPWQASFAPTQVQVVDLLQLFTVPPLGDHPRKLAVILSAWDAVAAESLSPEAFLAERMPLLSQYLANNTETWIARVLGLSAQGGDLDRDGDRLREEDVPSSRIRLVNGATESHDLTEPLAWLVT